MSRLDWSGSAEADTSTSGVSAVGEDATGDGTGVEGDEVGEGGAGLDWVQAATASRTATPTSSPSRGADAITLILGRRLEGC